MRDLWLKWRRWRQRDMTLGERGEASAARHLKKKGYRILGRNLRMKHGEVDLLCRDPSRQFIVVVEVKSGSSEDPRPETHVNQRKQRKLIQLANSLKNRYALHDYVWRFDVVAVVWPDNTLSPSRLTHIEDAFRILNDNSSHMNQF